MPSPRLTPIPMSTLPSPTATATPPSTAATTTTARGPLTPSPRPTPGASTAATMATPAPTEATTATPAPTDTPTTAKCTKDLRSSTGRRDQPTQQYSKKCDEPTITSKLPKKRPAPCALYLSQSTKLPLAETVLMMSARKKQNTE